MYKSGLTAVLSAFLIITLYLSSCTAQEIGLAQDTADKNDNTEETEAVVLYRIPAVQDFGGYNFTILSKYNTDLQLYDASEQDGTTINDIIYTRNRKTEENYNITITVVTSDDANKVITNSVTANEDAYDAASYFTREMLTGVSSGYYTNLLQVGTLQTGEPWWDARSVDGLTINGKLFLASGDIFTRDDIVEMLIIFNKSLYQNYYSDNLYESVNNGIWTLEKMRALALSVNTDLDGDGKMGDGDQWGLLGDVATPYYLYIGSGYSAIQKQDGEYVTAVDTERSFGILENILTLVTSGDGMRISEKVKGGYDGAEKLFTGGQVLFNVGLFEASSRFRDLEDDFGFLPIPKYEESQSGYYCPVHWANTPIAIPITNGDTERTGLILDALAYESFLTLTPALYDVFLSEKVARDEESKQMIDLIRNSKVYDLDYIANITGLVTIVSNASTSGKADLVSSYEKVRIAADEKLQNFIESYGG